jgi:hypothetical protein
MGDATKLTEVRKNIKNKYPESSFKNSLGPYSYKEYEEITSSKYISLKQTVGLKIYKNSNKYIIFLTISTFFLFTFPFMNKLESYNIFIIVLYTLCFGTIIYSLYSIFFKKKKLFLETNDKSFILNQKREIYWNEIVVTGILTVRGIPSFDYVILGLSSNEILKIDTNGTNIYPKDFIKIILFIFNFP